jgi:hypothetical protein
LRHGFISDCRLQISDCRFRIADFRSQIAELGAGSGDSFALTS